MKKKNYRKYVASFAAIAILAIVVLVTYPLLNKDGKKISAKSAQTEDSKIEQQINNEPADARCMEYGDYTIPLTTLELEIEYSEPASLKIAKCKSIQFTEEDKACIIQNLEKNGWNNVSGKLSSFQSDTQFMLNFSQPETYDYSAHGEKGETPNFSATAKHDEYAQQFLKDSSIIKVLSGHSVELFDTPSDETFATLFYGNFDGYRTETYLRLHFSPDGTLEDAQLYAVTFEDILVTSNVLSVKEAIKNAFYCSECTGIGSDKYSIIDVELVYRSGFPFYELELTNKQNGMIMAGYALAVEYKDIESDKKLKETFQKLMKNGIW